MSKRFPTAPNNPVQRYFSWNGAASDGHVSYWDKEAEREVKIEFPFVFLPLDKLSCVTGFNAQQEENVYSNEVRNTQREVLNVRVGKHTVAQGLYQEVKDKVNNQGGKFTSSVYIAYRDDSGDLQIGNIKFRGASLGPWIDLQNSAANLSESAVAITGSELDSQGSIEYRTPTMEVRPVKEQTDKEADRLYDKVTEYLDWKVERNEIEEIEAEPEMDGKQVAEDTYGDPFPENMDEIDDDLPF